MYLLSIYYSVYSVILYTLYIYLNNYLLISIKNTDGSVGSKALATQTRSPKSDPWNISWNTYFS